MLTAIHLHTMAVDNSNRKGHLKLSLITISYTCRSQKHQQMSLMSLPLNLALSDCYLKLERVEYLQ